MAPLKTLEKDYPIIDSNFQRFCASHGIFTVEDFLIHDLNALLVFVENEYNSERLKQGIDQILSILDGLHRSWLNGTDLFKDVLQNKPLLSTGDDGIDSFLHDGIRKGFLTELVGPSSSGKTQTCLQVAASIAKIGSGRVVYLDTSNSFSPQRILYMIRQLSNSNLIELLKRTYTDYKLQDNQESLKRIMSNISCCPVFDIFTLLDLLLKLESILKNQAGDELTELLIVDSISSLIAPVLGGSGSNGHALMFSAGFLLKKLAHEYNIAVLVTNHMVGGEGGSPKPALGESWKSIPHVRLLLSNEREGRPCSISILKHPSIAAGKVLRIGIYGDG